MSHGERGLHVGLSVASSRKVSFTQQDSLKDNNVKEQISSQKSLKQENASNLSTDLSLEMMD